MHPYILHLLSDITAAHRTDFPKEIYPQTGEQHFEEIDKWVSAEEPEHTFGYYCGLNPENFPPPEQLNDEEMVIVRKKFEKMMFTWNHALDLPKNLPVPFAYKIIVASLNEKTNIMNSGQMHFDFCSGYAPDCAFKEYCPCLEYWKNPIDLDVSGENNDDISGDYDSDFPF